MKFISSEPLWKGAKIGIRMRSFLALQISILLTAMAQTAPEKVAADPSLLENAGKPMSVQFQCADQDIQWFGLGCTEEEPCPNYLELSAFEPVGSQLFLSGNIHSASNTLYSVLLASSDGGKTWREPFERIRAAGIDRVQFVDFQHGWASGQVLHPLPGDPFVLLTTDGGKSWRRRPVFDENRAGSIQQMWFDSPSSGSLVFESASGEGMRYELYESATGGDGWMVREASDKPLRIKRMPVEPANADWRLRPDAPSNSYRIEKRQGGQWTVVASFLVQIGVCKPAPVKVMEPPSESTTTSQEPPAPTSLSLPALRGEQRPVKKPKK